ncbi:hypothetical protein G9A89_020138 [Geosiphon pyriformis]|nr:hypothetical protein G9A89_020138 [Geosiphon pyriformis]
MFDSQVTQKRTLKSKRNHVNFYKDVINNQDLLEQFRRFAGFAHDIYSSKTPHGFYSNGANLKADIFTDKKNGEVIVSIRAKRKIMDELDFSERVNSLIDYLYVPGGLVDKEFYEMFELDRKNLIDDIQRLLNLKPHYRLCLTGHDIGGVFAIFAGLKIQRKHPELHIDIFTFGQPRIGNANFIRHLQNSVYIYRITHTDDYVPQLPPKTNILDGYWHSNPEYWISSEKCDCGTSFKTYQCLGEMVPGIKPETFYFTEHTNCNAGAQNPVRINGISSHNGPYFGYFMGDEHDM